MPQCPSCKSPNAYIGWNEVECVNPECPHYSAAHRSAEAQKYKWPMLSNHDEIVELPKLDGASDGLT